MPVPLPNLDDRTYDELVAEARALIPALDPNWTDHNASDPGIVLVELLAWLTEMLLFQVNEVPPASTAAFLSLLNGPNWTLGPGESLDEATARTMSHVRERYRAVTAEDFEHLALHDWPTTEAARALGDAGRIARVRCVPRRNLPAEVAAAEKAKAEPVPTPAPAHVSLVVVPERPLGAVPAVDVAFPRPSPELRAQLSDYFAPRRTLTTRLHVVAPHYTSVGIGASLGLVADAPPEQALADARAALVAFFDPLTGGPEGTGWPFGRDVHASEVYAVLEKLPLLDHVDDVRVTGLRPLVGDEGTAVGAALDAHELVALGLVDLAAYDVNGKRYDPPPTTPPVIPVPPPGWASGLPPTLPAAAVVGTLASGLGGAARAALLGATGPSPFPDQP